MRDAWQLDDSIHFLNHGSYGATPRVVLQRQRALQDRLEAEPVRFMSRELEPLLDAARERLASFVGAQPSDLAFVTNATTGVNAVLSSLELSRGDELLTTNHGYNACTNALKAVAERAGAVVVVAKVPFPVTGADALFDAVLAAVTPKTKLVLLDQVTSPTALVFPIDRLVQALEPRGIPVLVDAAHAPGQVPLHLDVTGASFTTGNLHKWVCAPKGSAFLHVRRDWQPRVRPAVISHGANSPRTDRSRWQLEFDWTGTHDPSSYLCVPEALDFMERLVPGGWPALMARNHADAVAARAFLLDAMGGDAPCPPELLGAMASLFVPGAPPDLGERLFHEFHIEVPVIPWGADTLVRVSLQRHVRPGDIPALARALQKLTAGGPRRTSVRPVNRYAAIDVGTNSVLLLVADRQPDGRFIAVEERAEITRLGKGVDQAKKLSPDAIKMTLDVLERYAKDARELGAQSIVCSATSAARDASNGHEFLDGAKHRAGLDVEIISGDEEARLSFASAHADFGGQQPLVVLDIGGGSTEFIYGDVKGQVGFRKSFDVGAVRLTERFIQNDPPSAAELAAIEALLQQAFSELPTPPAGFRLVGVAGTVTTLCAVARRIEPYDPTVVHGSPLNFDELNAALQRLASLPNDLRKTVPGLQPKRSDVIVAGGLIFRAAMRALEVTESTVSDRGLRWGLLADRFGSEK